MRHSAAHFRVSFMESLSLSWLLLLMINTNLALLLLLRLPTCYMCDDDEGEFGVFFCIWQAAEEEEEEEAAATAAFVRVKFWLTDSAVPNGLVLHYDCSGRTFSSSSRVSLHNSSSRRIDTPVLAMTEGEADITSVQGLVFTVLCNPTEEDRFCSNEF
jgi:hypothetical protein